MMGLIDRREISSQHQVPLLLCLLVALTTLLVVQTGFSHADEVWVDTCEVGPFSCWADFPLERIRPFLSQLVDLQNDLVKHLGISPAEEKINLLLFRNHLTYSSYLRRNYPNVPQRQAFFIKHKGACTVLAYWNENFYCDVRHECTHALLHANLPMVPLWLDEGLAKYYELTPKERAFGNPLAHKLILPLMIGDGTKLEHLESLGDYKKMTGDDYRDCWAWVHFILHGPPEAHDELVLFLREIELGNNPGLMSKRLAGRMSKPTVRCANHHRAWKRR
ncbi:MAG: hypothetical protein JXM70_23015 [Pirellulales bacterium]|nr:hypothetical protein [Pirellulales bacterium]